MNKLILTIIVNLFLLTTLTNINAQKQPKPSPLGKVEQIVGVTKLNLEYSRPSVKGRVIFGKLVPYNKIWRLGANACTKLETSTDIMIDGKTLPKGKYALFAIPSKKGTWEIIFNSDVTLRGTGRYDKAKDVIRTSTKAKVNPFTETLSIDFDKITVSSAVISIKWDKLIVNIPFTIDTEKYVKEYVTKISDIKERLIEGNKRFVNDKLEGKQKDSKRRSELTSGQKPFATILSCADSRVVPEFAFDTGLGELFVVRVAGNVANTSSLASIEYAVAKTGSNIIVVLGHENCGAVTAAKKGGNYGYSLNHLLAHITPALEASPNDATINEIVKKNVELTASDLVERSEIISNAVKSGHLEILSAYYNLNTGKVDFF